MSDRYADRDVFEVSVYGLGPIVMAPTADEGPEEGITARVVFGLAALDGGWGGPSATIELSLVASPDISIRDAHAKVIEAAYDLVRRLAAEPLEKIMATMAERQAESLNRERP